MLPCETGFLSVELGSCRESFVLTMQLFLREPNIAKYRFEAKFFSVRPSTIERDEFVKKY